MFETILIDIRV